MSVDRGAVEQFLYLEARLLDARAYEEWLELFDEKSLYWIPSNCDDIDPARHVSIVYADRGQLELAAKDGRTDLAARSEKVRASLAARNVRLVVIAVGADAALDFLALLSGSAGEVRRAEELGDLRALFEREVLGERVVAAPRIEARWSSRAQGSLAAAIA